MCDAFFTWFWGRGRRSNFVPLSEIKRLRRFCMHARSEGGAGLECLVPMVTHYWAKDLKDVPRM
jgi:hypothetical protein